MRKWLLLIGVALCFTGATALYAQDATEEMPMEEMMMSGTVVCDQDLTLLRYIAEYYFDFAAVVDQLALEGLPTVDLAAYDLGQYTPHFASMMGMMDEMMAMPNSALSDEALPAVLDMMRLGDEEFKSMMTEMMPDMGMYTELTSLVVDGEALECAAMRAELHQFFCAIAYVNQSMMGEGM